MAFAFSPSGRALASCGDSSRAIVWRLPWMRAQAELGLAGSTGLALAFLTERHLAVTTGRCVEVWCAQEGVLLCSEALEASSGRAVTLAACSHPHGPCLAVGFEDGSVVVWNWHENTSELSEAATLEHETSVAGLSWASGGNFLAVAGISQVVLWWHDDEDWFESAVIEADECIGYIYDMCLSGSLCAAGGTEGTACVWQLSLHPHSADDECVCPLTCSSPRGDLSSGASSASQAVTFFAHALDEGGAINSVCLSADSRHLATGGADSRLVLWCLSSGSMLMTFYHRLPPSSCNLCTACVNAMRFAPDCKTLVAGGYDGVVTVWKLQQKIPIGGF